jgi:hypothetical protein
MDGLVNMAREARAEVSTKPRRGRQRPSSQGSNPRRKLGSCPMSASRKVREAFGTRATQATAPARCEFGPALSWCAASAVELPQNLVQSLRGAPQAGGRWQQPPSGGTKVVDGCRDGLQADASEVSHRTRHVQRTGNKHNPIDGPFLENSSCVGSIRNHRTRRKRRMEL